MLTVDSSRNVLTLAEPSSDDFGPQQSLSEQERMARQQTSEKNSKFLHFIIRKVLADINEFLQLTNQRTY